MAKRATILIIDQGESMFDGEKHLRALEVARRVVESKVRWGGGESLNILVAGRAGAGSNLLGLAGVWDSAHRDAGGEGGGGGEDEDAAADYNPYLRAPSAADVAGLSPARFPRAGAAPTDLWRALGVALSNLEEAERIGGALLPLPAARRPGCVRIVIVSDFCGVVNAGAQGDTLRRCAGVLAEFGAQIDLVMVGDAGEEAVAGAGGAAGGGGGGGGAIAGGDGRMYGRTEEEEMAEYNAWEREEMDDPGAPTLMGAAEGGGGGGGGGAPASAAGGGAGGGAELKSLQRLLLSAAGPGAAPPTTVPAMLIQLLAAQGAVKGRAFSAAAALAAFSVRAAPQKASRFHTALHLCGGAGGGGVTLPASLFLTSVAAKPPRLGTVTEAAAGSLQGTAAGGGGARGGPPQRVGFVTEQYQHIVPPPNMPPAEARAAAAGVAAEAAPAAARGGGGGGDDEGGGAHGYGDDDGGAGALHANGDGGGGGGGGGLLSSVELAIDAARVTAAFRYGRTLVPVPRAPPPAADGAPPPPPHPLRAALVDRGSEPGGIHVVHFSTLASLPRWALCGRPRWLLPAAAATGKKGDKGGGGAAFSALVAAMAQRGAFALLRVVARKGANPALFAALPALDAASAHTVMEGFFGDGGGGGAGAGGGDEPTADAAGGDARGALPAAISRLLPRRAGAGGAASPAALPPLFSPVAGAHGLALLPLPWADDVRGNIRLTPPFTSTVWGLREAMGGGGGAAPRDAAPAAAAHAALVTAFDGFVSALDLGAAEGWRPARVPNPYLLRFDAFLRARGGDPAARVPPPQDCLPQAVLAWVDPARVAERGGPAVPAALKVLRRSLACGGLALKRDRETFLGAARCMHPDFSGGGGGAAPAPPARGGGGEEGGGRGGGARARFAPHPPPQGPPPPHPAAALATRVADTLLGPHLLSDEEGARLCGAAAREFEVLLRAALGGGAAPAAPLEPLLAAARALREAAVQWFSEGVYDAALTAVLAEPPRGTVRAATVWRELRGAGLHAFCGGGAQLGAAEAAEAAAGAADGDDPGAEAPPLPAKRAARGATAPAAGGGGGGGGEEAGAEWWAADAGPARHHDSAEFD
jgi:hypothetical protein